MVWCSPYGAREPVGNGRRRNGPIWVRTTNDGAPCEAPSSNVPQASSKRSRFITLVHAATKSVTNFATASCDAYTSAMRPQLRVRSEDEVAAGAGPSRGAGRPITTFEHVIRCGGRLPHGVDVEQVHEEVVRERLRAMGEDTVNRTVGVRVQHTHAADEHRHLRGGQRQQLGAIDQQRLRGSGRGPFRGSCGTRRPSARGERTTPRRSAPGWHRCVPA